MKASRGKGSPGAKAKSKTSRPKPASARKKPASKQSTTAAKKTKTKPRVSAAAIANARKMEKLDAKSPPRAPVAMLGASLQNSSYPKTYIAEVDVSLDDPNHTMTLTWTGPDAATQQTGPFHTSPGAGLRGLNCDDAATSQRSGTLCTPKGNFVVEAFASHLNTDSRATFVTFFKQSRGIGLHYFPTVPNYAASHGCVRIQDVRIARLIHDNARVGLTKVTVSGTWTKPPHQW